MSKGTELSTLQLDLTRCPICLQSYTDPKSLPTCVHSACLKCLETLAESSTTLACPVCFKEFSVPKDGLTSLVSNVLSSRLCLTESLLQVAELKSRLTCDVCSSSEEKVAQSYCADCRLKLCENCSSSHLSSTDNRHRFNVLLKLTDDSTKVSEKLSDIQCDVHREEKLRLYCYECDAAHCVRCFVDRHQDHHCSEIGRAESTLRGELQTAMAELSKHIEKNENFMMATNGEVAKCFDEISDIENAVRQQAERMKVLVDRQKDTLLRKLDLGKRWKVAKAEEANKNWTIHMSAVKFVHSLIDKLQSTGSPTELSLMARYLRMRTDELVNNDCERALDVFRASNLEFSPSDLLVENEAKIVGEIKFTLNGKGSVQVVSAQKNSKFDITRCTHCSRVFTEPRSLPCFHMFCVNCIPSIVATNASTCPLCRKEFQMSEEGGLDKFAVNAFVEKMSQVNEFMLVASNELSVCDLCSSSTGDTMISTGDNMTSTPTTGDNGVEMMFASFYCVDCKAKLCNRCTNSHALDHRRLKFDEVVKSSTGSLVACLETSCRNHVGEAVYLFCFDCSLVLCAKCLEDRHRKHKYAGISRLEGRFRRDLVELSVSLVNEVDKQRKRLSDLRELKDAIDAEIEKARSEIEEQANAMRLTISKDEEKLVEKVSSSHHLRIQYHLDKQANELKQHATLVEGTKTYLEELKNKGSVVDITREATAVMRASNQLLKFDLDIDHMVNEWQSVEYAVFPSNAMETTSDTCKNTLGRIEIKWTPQGEEDQLFGVTVAPTGSRTRRKHDVIRCWVCSDVYTDPRSLPCMHTFCFQCLVAQHQAYINLIRCPLCADDWPMTSVDGLPKNVFVRKLIRIREMTNVPGGGWSLCEACSGGGSYNVEEETGSINVNVAKEYCIDCRMKLCKGCKLTHIKSKETRSHAFVKILPTGTIDEYSNVTSQEKSEEENCSDHEGLRLTLYCHECLVVACATCVEESHAAHRCSDIRSVVREVQRAMTNHVNGLTTQIERDDLLIGRLEEVRIELEKKARTVLRQIAERAEQAISLVEQNTEILLTMLSTNKTRRTANLVRSINELESGVLLVEWLINYVDELTTNGTAVDLARQRRDVQYAADELAHGLSIDNLPVHLGFIKVEYSASELPVPGGCRNVLGKVTEKLKVTGESPELISEFDVSKTHELLNTVEQALIKAEKKSHTSPLSTRFLTDGHPIRGLAILANKLAVVRLPTEQHIEIYDSSTLQLRKRFFVAGLGDVTFGMTSCSTNSCFYVSDWQNKTIHRIRATLGGGTSVSGFALGGWKVTRWKVLNDPTGLSVNRFTNVIVAYWNCDFLHEFTTRGSLVRRINLQPDVVNPWHAVSLPSDEQQSEVKYVVSHGESNDPTNRVCVIDGNGSVLQSYGDRPGSGPGQLNVPICLVVVTRTKNILVADQRNDRILVFRPPLRGPRDLMTSIGSELRGPCALFLDESRNRLFVGEWNGRMVVFDNVFELSGMD